MNRRQFCTMIGSVGLAAGGCSTAGGTGPSLFTRSELLAIESARGLAEYEYRDQPITEAQRPVRLYSSSKPIGAESRQFIIECEVSSRSNYVRKLQSPIWPKLDSGVTIGIGYDLGYVTSDLFKTDWEGLIPSGDIESLVSTCGLRGDDARDARSSVAQVVVPWDAALTQFDRYLPYAAGETTNAFPNTELLGPNAFGALVSLVYNRGGGMRSRPGDLIDRRREMREVRDLLREKNFADVPAKIREMTRIWKDNPDARGLLIRREKEAQLFEQDLEAAI